MSESASNPKSTHPAAPALRLLGKAVLVDGAGAEHPLALRDAALLVILAMQGAQSRAGMARLLWPDVPDGTAAGNLRQRLFRLAKISGSRIVEGKDTLQLAEAVRHDLDVIAALAGGAEGRGLLEALDYPDGDELAERIALLRDQWLQRCSAELERQAQALETDEAYEAALPLAERLLQLQRSSELAWRRVIRLHYLLADAPRALETFNRCEQALAAIGLQVHEDTLAIVRWIRSAQPTGRVRPHLTLARPPMLIGRERDWSVLAQAWQRGAVVVLRGAPGIGKTRLASDFIRSLGPVQAVKARVDSRDRTYGVLGQLLKDVLPGLPRPSPRVACEVARLLPEWGSAPHTPLEPGSFNAAVIEAFGDWRGAGLGTLFIDDLQWVDAPSLESLLAWLAHAERRPPTLLSLRTDEPVPALEAWLDQRPAGDVIEHVIGPLDGADVRSFVESLQLPDVDPAQARTLAEDLSRRVGGHPFLMLEVLRAAALPPAQGDGAQPHAGTEQLLRTLERRIGRLPAGPLRLLRLAALAGQGFTVPLAATVLGRHAVDLVDDWNVLAGEQLIQEEGLVFDLVVEATRRSIPRPIANALHGQLAQALAEAGDRSEVVAAHWQAAQQWLPAAQAYSAAAGRAEGLARPAEALASWDQAAQCFERAGSRQEQCQALLSATRCAAVAEGSQDLIDRARRLVEMAEPGPTRIDALIALGRALVKSADLTGSSTVQLEQALDEARPCGDLHRQVEASGWLAHAHATNSQVANAEAVLRQAMPLLEQIDDGAASQSFQACRGASLCLAGHYAESLEASREAIRIAAQLGDTAAEMRSVGDLVMAHDLLGDLRAACEAGDRALQLWERLGRPMSTESMGFQVHLAFVNTAQGRFSRALELAERARAHFKQTGALEWCAAAESRIFSVYFRLGQHARARQALQPLPPGSFADRRIGLLMLRCRAEHAEGKSVIALLRQAADAEIKDLLPRNQVMLKIIMAVCAPAEDALEFGNAALEQAKQLGDPAAVVLAHAWLAEALRRNGRANEAAEFARLAWDGSRQRAPWGMEHVEFCSVNREVLAKIARTQPSP